VPVVDTIGVPVFAALKGNEMFVPEMDGDFRITNFSEFVNEQGFQITYSLPLPYRDTKFSVGSPAPIPFWIEQKCFVIGGDADKEEPEKLFGRGALRNPVLSDIAQLLDDARSGRISDRMKEWASTNIANSFSDVFFEPPARSRYWVSRYRVAIANARKMVQPPHPIDAKLRQVGSDWLHKFGSKTDLSNICGILGSSGNEIFSRRQMGDILFAFLMSKIADNQSEAVEEYAREKPLHGVFPDGIYNYYLQHGWPRVPFAYTQIDDLSFRLMTVLSECNEREDYSRAARFTFMLFGRQRAPAQIESLACIYLKDEPLA
jgi:hypothetical protein